MTNQIIEDFQQNFIQNKITQFDECDQKRLKEYKISVHKDGVVTMVNGDYKQSILPLCL